MRWPVCSSPGAGTAAPDGHISEAVGVNASQGAPYPTLNSILTDHPIGIRMFSFFLLLDDAARSDDRPEPGVVSAALLFIVSLLLIVFPSSTAAQGFGVYEQGTCVMGRGGAAVADPCDDGSAVFFNPAGLAGTTGFTFSAGATLIMAEGSFTADQTGAEIALTNAPIPVPHAYLQYGITDRLAAGLGVYVPYGLTTEWPVNFSGRFVGFDNTLQSIYVQPTVSYQLTDAISIGGGLNVVIGFVELNQRLDLADQPLPSSLVPSDLPESVERPVTFAQFGIPPQTDFATAQLEARGATGLGGNIGIQIQATDWIRLGARFMTPVKLNYDGTADFEQVSTGLRIPATIEVGETVIPAGFPVDNLLAPQFASGGLLIDQDIQTEITMPAQAVAGISLRLIPGLNVLADYQWTGWSAFDEIPLDFENDALDATRVERFDNTNALRLGAEYDVSDALQLRGGYITHSAAAPDITVTPLLPEAYRNEFTVGFGWQPVDLLELNVAYQFINQIDRRGRVREAPPGEEPTEELNSGIYSFYAHLAGVTLTVRL